MSPLTVPITRPSHPRLPDRALPPAVRRRRSAGLAAGLVATSLVLGGCGFGGGATSTSGSGSGSGSVGAAVPAKGFAVDPAAEGGATSTSQDAGASSGNASTGSPRAAGASSVAGTLTSLPQAAPAAGQDVVRTADMSVSVADRTKARATALTKVAARGGFVADEQSTYDPGNTGSGGAGGSTQLSLRVPVDAYTPLLEDLAGLGDVLGLQQSSTVVTDQVVDVKSRIASQQASVARVRTLLDQATTLSDVLEVESELARRQADLESLQARYAALADAAALSTVRLTLFTHGDSITNPKDDHGFLAGLSAGWDAFTQSMQALLTATGAALPFAALLALLVAGAVGLRRRTHPRTPAVETPSV